MTATPPTPARASRAVLLVFGSIALLTLLFGVFAIFRDPTKRESRPPLLVYCDASLKAAVERAAANYEKETGVRLDLSFGDSETLLASLEGTKRGDLYLPADDARLVSAREKGLVEDVVPLAQQTAMIAVARENPKTIAVALLRSSKQPKAARAFANYLADPEKGSKAFEEQGFKALNR